jgi:hypothetical protein
MQIRLKRGGALSFALLGLVALLYAPRTAAQQADSAFGEQAGADKAAAASQQRIDQLQDQTQDLVARYRQALSDTESIKKYNEQLALQVKSQATTVEQKRKQLADIENTQRDVLPLMQKMIDTLAQFVALDVPFLMEERSKRVTSLKELLRSADVSSSEKYRRILEAYQIEMEYGRTLDSYEGTLGQGGAQKTVQFVRVGRVALLYQTLDGEQTGYWDVARKTWVQDDDYAADVREALRVAKKQGAPDLLMVPLPAPRGSKS